MTHLASRRTTKLTGPRVDADAMQATGPHHKKRTRAAPVHAELDLVLYHLFTFNTMPHIGLDATRRLASHVHPDVPAQAGGPARYAI